MGKKLYVGNLGYGINNSSLEELFAAHGTVASAQVIVDRDTGRSKGFGFVEKSSDSEAQAAINAMHGKAANPEDCKLANKVVAAFHRLTRSAQNERTI